MKYNYKNPVENSDLYLGDSNIYEFHGIFEIKDNKLLSKLNISQLKKYNRPKINLNVKQQLGLDHKDKYSDLLKYNDEFLRKFGERDKYYFRLNDLIDIIYSIGNIKQNEKVVIISNHCRGTDNKNKEAWNTIYDLSNESKKKGMRRRRVSKTNMLKSIYE